MIIFVAKDKDGTVGGFTVEPKRELCSFEPVDENFTWLEFKEGSFPEITWENSPVQFELKRIKK